MPTGCCQHPDSVGSSCAWHGQESPNGAFWAVEKNDEIIAVSWVWRSEEGQGDSLVLDNIEMTESMGQDTSKRVLSLYQQAANNSTGKLGIANTYLGTQHSDVAIIGDRMERPFDVPKTPDGYSVYTDSDTIIKLKNKELDEVEFDTSKLIAEQNEIEEIEKQNIVDHILKVESTVYPESFQDINDNNIENWEGLTEYIGTEPAVMTWNKEDDGADGYMIYTATDVEDIASDGQLPLRVGNEIMGELAENFVDRPFEARMREETSYKFVKAFADRGYMTVQEDENNVEQYGDESFHNVRLKFTEKGLDKWGVKEKTPLESLDDDIQTRLKEPEQEIEQEDTVLVAGMSG